MSFKELHKRTGIPFWIYDLEATYVCWHCKQLAHPDELTYEGGETGVLNAPGAMFHYCPDGNKAEVVEGTRPSHIKIVGCSHRGCDAARPLDGVDDWYGSGRRFADDTGRLEKKHELCPKHQREEASKHKSAKTHVRG